MTENYLEGKKTQDLSDYEVVVRLLEILSGTTDEDGLVDGPNLWNVNHTERSKAILNHSLLVFKVADSLGRELKNKKVKGFEDISLRDLDLLALTHDAGKQYGVTREFLPEEKKKTKGIPSDFKEESMVVDEKVVSWLSDLNISPLALEALKDHNFPSQVYENPYWKIILVADYMAGQEVSDVLTRVSDVGKRWVYDRIEKGNQPRITPERFEGAKEIILSVARDIFEALGVSDKEFIIQHNLSSDESQLKIERFLRKTTENKTEERAKHLLEVFHKK